MSKKAKIISLLLFIFLGLLVYLMLSTKEVTVKTKTPQSSEEYAKQVQEKMKKIEDQYISDFKKIITEYEGLIGNVTMSGEDKISEIIKLRQAMMVLTVPAQYLEMNKNVFNAFTKAEDMGIESLDENISEISSLINDAKTIHYQLSN